MTQTERRIFLISKLLKEDRTLEDTQIPQTEEEQKILLRSLFNIRSPHSIDDNFLQIQDEYLQEELSKKKITLLSDLTPIEKDLYIWRGDITLIKCGAIVNAANSGMTGCYQPCHACIDNCIHTFSGIQLRNYCNDLIIKQGFLEPTGKAKITPAFNLPCDYVIHTVGPIVQGELTDKHCELLKSCYESCLQIATENNIQSIAFCCISTGVFHFPIERAAEIAVQTVRDYKKKNNSNIEVIFNVFSNRDEQVYKRIFAEN